MLCGVLALRWKDARELPHTVCPRKGGGTYYLFGDEAVARVLMGRNGMPGVRERMSEREQLERLAAVSRRSQTFTVAARKGGARLRSCELEEYLHAKRRPNSQEEKAKRDKEKAEKKAKDDAEKAEKKVRDQCNSEDAHQSERGCRSQPTHRPWLPLPPSPPNPGQGRRREGGEEAAERRGEEEVAGQGDGILLTSTANSTHQENKRKAEEKAKAKEEADKRKAEEAAEKKEKQEKEAKEKEEKVGWVGRAEGKGTDRWRARVRPRPGQHGRHDTRTSHLASRASDPAPDFRFPLPSPPPEEKGEGGKEEAGRRRGGARGAVPGASQGRDQVQRVRGRQGLVRGAQDHRQLRDQREVLCRTRVDRRQVQGHHHVDEDDQRHGG